MQRAAKVLEFCVIQMDNKQKEEEKSMRKTICKIDCEKCEACGTDTEIVVFKKWNSQDLDELKMNDFGGFNDTCNRGKWICRS